MPLLFPTLARQRGIILKLAYCISTFLKNRILSDQYHPDAVSAWSRVMVVAMVRSDSFLYRLNYLLFVFSIKPNYSRPHNRTKTEQKRHLSLLFKEQGVGFISANLASPKVTSQVCLLSYAL